MENDNKSINAVVKGRFLTGEALDAATQHAQFLSGSERTEVLARLKEWSEACPYARSSMKTRFHPAVLANPWLESLQRDYDWVLRLRLGSTELPVSKLETPVDYLALKAFVQTLMAALGITKITGYVLTSGKDKKAKPAKKAKKVRGRQAMGSKERQTCKAKFELPSTSDRKKLEHGFDYPPNYERALKFLSKLCGRLHNWFEPWASANALVLAKTGVLTFLVTDEDLAADPLTTIFLALAVSEFGARKAFTLESQKQGGLNEHLSWLLEKLLVSKTSRLDLVAMVYPEKRVFEACSQEQVQKVYTCFSSWLPVLGQFLDEQWARGVWKSARRDMRVLPKGANVNSTGYNSVADAWQNAVRFVRLCVSVKGIEGAPLLLKVPQLIANDQFNMGQWQAVEEPKTWANIVAGSAPSVKKSTHKDTDVFDDLTRANFLPWNAVLRPAEFENAKVLSTLVDSCVAHSVRVEGWLGLPKPRKAEVKQHSDMICGVSVPQISEECAALLKLWGFAGANQWQGN